MTLEEYLHTPFDGPDRDYVDGEVVERNMGELPHARIQMRLGYLLSALSERLQLQVLPEIRLQVTPTHFRVADLAVWPAGRSASGSLRPLPFSRSKSFRLTIGSSECSQRFRSTSRTASHGFGSSIRTIAAR